jgi:hypothetical protein
VHGRIGGVVGYPVGHSGTVSPSRLRGTERAPQALYRLLRTAEIDQSVAAIVEGIGVVRINRINPIVVCECPVVSPDLLERASTRNQS